MRYLKIVFLCDPTVYGYMECSEPDDEGKGSSLVRLTDVNGVTFKKLPAAAYSVINDEPEKPAWGS